MTKYDITHIGGDTYKITKITEETFFIKSDGNIKEIFDK